jgi:predicted nucleic acid-binding protein
VKVFFDTSVLVACFHESLPHHLASWRVVAGEKAGAGYCGAHGLAEIYATLTGMAKPRRTSAAAAMVYIDGLRDRLSVVGLSPEEYAATLAGAAEHGIMGGGIYDALLAQCALKAGADVIYTWNVRDFERCGPKVARRLRTPAMA